MDEWQYNWGTTAFVTQEPVYFSLPVSSSFAYSWWASQDQDEQCTAQQYTSRYGKIIADCAYICKLLQIILSLWLLGQKNALVHNAALWG